MPTAVCPICDRPIDPAIRQLQQAPERHLIRQLQAHHPDWDPEQGACPQCVFQAALWARAARSDHSLQQELGLPFPAYLADQAYLLPTPLRVAVRAPGIRARG